MRLLLEECCGLDRGERGEPDVHRYTDFLREVKRQCVDCLYSYEDGHVYERRSSGSVSRMLLSFRTLFSLSSALGTGAYK